MQILKENQNGFGIIAEGFNSTCIIKRKLSEGIEQSKNFIISGIMAQGDIKNRNGRVYPFYKIMKPEVDRFIKEEVEGRKAAMELNHPDSLDLNVERICARTTKLWYEGSNVVGEAIVGNEGLGKFVQDLFHMGFEIGASTRGTGTVSNGIVESDFRLYFIDIVFNPSAHQAIMNQGVREAQETLIKESLLTEQELEHFSKALKRMNPADRLESFKLYNKFIKAIKTRK